MITVNNKISEKIHFILQKEISSYEKFRLFYNLILKIGEPIKKEIHGMRTFNNYNKLGYIWIFSSE